MNILFISNIGDDNKAGLFFSVVNRSCNFINKYLVSNKNVYCNLCLRNKELVTLKIIKMILKKPCCNINKKFFYYSNVKFNYILNYKGAIYSVINNFNSNFDIKRLYKYIESKINLNNFDIIQAHWCSPLGNIALELKKTNKIPYVLTVHGSDIHTIPFKDNNSKEKALLALNNANKVIFVSNELLKIAKRLGYSGKNATVIPNGIDTSIFKMLHKKKIKNKLGLDNKKVIGFVGNLVWIKRVDKFKPIFKFILEKEKNIKFLIIGDGVLKEDLIKELKEINADVIFTGRVEPSEVAYYMNAMDIMILPSRNEGWPCVVLEAQACGVPVVGSNNGGIPEAIGKNGGIAVKDGKGFEKRFAEEVIKQLHVNYNVTVLRERALKYTWDEIAKKEFEVYKEVINKTH